MRGILASRHERNEYVKNSLGSAAAPVRFLDVLQLCSRAEGRVMIGILVRRREQTEKEVVQ
jgi:hypothetical protein